MSSVENGSMIAAEFVANESSAGIWSPAPQKKKLTGLLPTAIPDDADVLVRISVDRRLRDVAALLQTDGGHSRRRCCAA
jgi:hypothetical protein